MNPQVGETHRETRGWWAVVSPHGGQRRWTDLARARTTSCLCGEGSHLGSMVWRWLDGRRTMEMGRRLVPPPPPTNRPQMRESGRERPPSPTRETGFRAIAEGRSRPACQCRRLTGGGPHRAGSGGTVASLVQGFAASSRSGKQATTPLRTPSSLPWSAPAATTLVRISTSLTAAGAPAAQQLAIERAGPSRWRWWARSRSRQGASLTRPAPAARLRP